MILVTSFQAHTDAINRIKQSPFNNFIVATASTDNTVKIWNVSTSCWYLIRNYTLHTADVFGLEWINEDTLVSGSLDGTIQIWSISTGSTQRTISTGSGVESLQLLYNDNQLAAALRNNLTNIYKTDTGSLIATLYGHTYIVSDLAFLGDNLLASSSYDATICIWNLSSSNPLKFNMKDHKMVSTEILSSRSSDMPI